MTSRKPCVLYESKFKVTELDTQKVENVVNRTVRSKKCPVFSSVHGIEGLFHVVDKFKRAASRLNLQDENLWDAFEDVLDTVAKSKWDNLIKNIADADKTDQRFDEEIKAFVKSYSQDDNARDVLVKYLKEQCRKPYKVTPQEHADRMESLINIANRLEGTEPEIDEDNKKKIIFETFPVPWQYSFKRSKDINSSTLLQIISFMTLCKCEADETDERKNKKQKVDTSRIRGGDGKKNSGGGKGKGLDLNQECPVHGRHKWGECSLNPRSENYQTRLNGGRFNNGQGRGFSQGRGRGRFNNYQSGGRNNFSQGNSGRGNFSQGRGRGRSNSYYSNQSNTQQYSRQNSSFQSQQSGGSGNNDQYLQTESNNSNQDGSYGWNQPDQYFSEKTERAWSDDESQNNNTKKQPKKSVSWQ